MRKRLIVILGVVFFSLLFLLTGKGFCTPILDDGSEIPGDDIWVSSPQGVCHFSLSDIMSTETDTLVFEPEIENLGGKNPQSLLQNSWSGWMNYSLWLDTSVSTSFPVGALEVTWPELSFVGRDVTGFTLRFDFCEGLRVIVYKWWTNDDNVTAIPESSTLLLFGLGLLGLLTGARRLIRRRKSSLQS